jgi:hypothetical protein
MVMNLRVPERKLVIFEKVSNYQLFKETLTMD